MKGLPTPYLTLRNLLILTQFDSNRSIQIKDCPFLFSSDSFLIPLLVLVVMLICPGEVTEHRASHEEELKTPSLPQHTHSTANHCILHYNYINPPTAGAKGFAPPPSS